MASTNNSSSSLSDNVKVAWQATTSKICAMTTDAVAQKLASDSGLSITKPALEATSHGLGPEPLDYTAEVAITTQGLDLPVIRDISASSEASWKLPIDQVPILVGNHDGSTLRHVSLREYLSNLRSYLHAPRQWYGSASSLLVTSGDEEVIMSAQASILPVPAEGEANFNVSVFNQQYNASKPALLTIISTIHGTSAQVLNSKTKTLLYHNKAGKRTSFVGQTPKPVLQAGSSQLSTPHLTSWDRAQNNILVITVPLKQEPDVATPSSDGGPPSASRPPPRAPLVQLAQEEGPFTEIGGVKMERDERYPIRITLQFYNSSSDGDVDAQGMKNIASELQRARKWPKGPEDEPGAPCV